MADNLSEAPVATNSVTEIQKTDTVIGPTTSINTDNGQPDTQHESIPRTSERQLNKEVFQDERAYVGQFTLQLLDKAQLNEGDNNSENQSALAVLKEKLKAGASNIALTQDEMKILEKLSYSYPPPLTDESQAQGLITHSHLRTLLSSYYGEEVQNILKNENANTIDLKEVNRIEEAARGLGLLTVDSEIDQNHWLCQTMSAAYRGLIMPNEIAQYMQFLSPKDRLLITPADFSPDSEFGQHFLDKEKITNLDPHTQNSTTQSLKHGLGEKLKNLPTLRVLLQERLDKKIEKIQQEASIEIYKAQQQLTNPEETEERIALIQKNAQTEAHNLEAEFYGLGDSKKLNERATTFLQRLNVFYSHLPQQEPSLQKAWLTLLSSQNQNDEEDNKTKAVAINQLMSAFGLDNNYRFEPGKWEKKGVKVAKIGFGLGVVALLFMLMQLYSGMSGSAEG